MLPATLKLRSINSVPELFEGIITCKLIIFFLLLLVIAVPANATIHIRMISSAYRGKIERVKDLFKEGADINARGKEGWTALMWAAYRGHVDVVRFLVEKGAYVNAKNNKGQSVLMWATKNGHIKIIELLKEAGAKW